MATNLAITTATSGGNITDDGGSSITASGVCWSNISNPTTADSLTVDGSGTGSYVSNLTNLDTNTVYCVRAYATNSVGTYYVNEVSFTTYQYYIGQAYAGGIIFYVDSTGQHGLVAAPTDQSSDAEWGCYGTSIPGTSSAIGTGAANTTLIVNGCSETGIAARICDDLVLNGYDDWFLPSDDEMSWMWYYRSIIGGFAYNDYWTSTESSANYAYTEGMRTEVKYHNINVRAVREF